jgi:thiamine-monophosphate kinase
MDISDGLVQDLGHIARASNVAIRVEAGRIPLSEALRTAFPTRALGLALSGGEDYQLVLIGPRPAIAATRRQTTVTITEVGEVVASGEPHVAVVDEAGLEMPLPVGGWDHLRKQ